MREEKHKQQQPGVYKHRKLVHQIKTSNTLKNTTEQKRNSNSQFFETFFFLFLGLLTLRFFALSFPAMPDSKQEKQQKRQN